MDRPPDEKAQTKAVLFGTLLASTLALGGGFLISRSSETAGYGWSMFLALPLATGLITGWFIHPMPAAALTMLLTVILCLVALLVTGLEGIICVCMAAPLILVESILGAVIGWMARNYVDRHSRGGPPLILFPT